jgi:hypothetical protein
VEGRSGAFFVGVCVLLCIVLLVRARGGGRAWRAAQDEVQWATPESTGGDQAFREGWLKGRRHRVTGEPLEVLCAPLPPGSMISAAAHMPHGVECREVGRGTRLCTLFACECDDPSPAPRYRQHCTRGASLLFTFDPAWCASVCTDAKPDPEEKLVRSPERRKGGYAVSPEVLQAAMEGRIKTVRAGRKNFFTMY